MADEIITKISETSSFGKTTIQKMLEARTKDEAQQLRVMRRIKLMLDPTGSSRGRDMLPHDFQNMSDEQKQAYESE